MTPQIKLLGYRVLVKLDRVETGVLVLPEDAREYITSRGTVELLGTGRINWQGDKAPFDVQVGDKVLLSEMAVTMLDGDPSRRIVAGEDILAVL